MKRAALFLSLLIVLLKFAQAQPSLGIDSISVVPDIVNFNQFVSITFKILNTGNDFFSGDFAVDYSVNNIFQGTLDSSINNLQIDTGGAVFLTVPNHQVTPLQYAVGDNIVVIWPVAADTNVVTTDSGTTHIQVDTALGTGPPILRQQIRVFYKSGDQDLFIDYGNMISHIKDVSCYSILGQQIAKYNYAVNKISFANSSKISLLVIRTREGETISFKILRI